MTLPAGPYLGQTAALVTLHGKDKAIARAFRAALNMKLYVTSDVDTDRLGTFAGDVERVGTPRDVAVRKARMGMESAGLEFGVANEGTFGAHPFVPFARVDHELLVFVDDAREFVLSESILWPKTNFASAVVSSTEEFDDFLTRALFPSHALIVRPNDRVESASIQKGVCDQVALRRAVAQAAALSADGKAWIETDMRASFNPTRMRVITRVACRLARRLATPCPSCGAPGWGRIRVEDGLPCSRCESPTEIPRGEVKGCTACDAQDFVARSDGLLRADPAQCQFCNP